MADEPAAEEDHHEQAKSSFYAAQKDKLDVGSQDTNLDEPVGGWVGGWVSGWGCARVCTCV